MVPVQIKVIVDKPVKTVKAAAVKPAPPVQAIAAPKATAAVKIVAPVRTGQLNQLSHLNPFSQQSILLNQKNLHRPNRLRHSPSPTPDP
jgi:hypothetical protein